MSKNMIIILVVVAVIVAGIGIGVAVHHYMNPESSNQMEEM